MELQAQNAADALTATRVGCCWQRCPSWLTRKAYLAPCRPLSSSGRDVGNSRAPSTISSPRPGDQCYIRIGRRGGVVVARGKRPSERCFASFSSPSSSSSSSSLSHSLTHSLTHSPGGDADCAKCGGGRRDKKSKKKFNREDPEMDSR
jgi:hypothetical protein